VRDINKLSHNVMAQQLFPTLGATQRGAGTRRRRARVISNCCARSPARLGGQVVIANVSGLSRESRLSALHARDGCCSGRPAR